MRLLEFLVISFDAPVAVCHPRSTSRTAAVRRRGEISNRARDIWYIPTRAESLLPGIEEDDLDSVAADSVDVSSSDFEEKKDALEGVGAPFGLGSNRPPEPVVPPRGKGSQRPSEPVVPSRPVLLQARPKIVFASRP